MNMTSRRTAWVAASLATVLGMTACGGGAVDASGQASASATDTQRATALGRRNPPPPPPPPAPATDATLALASASALGQAAEGDVCGVSANGSKVLLTSRAANLVTGDTNGLVDLFLKDFNGNGITRVVSAASNTPIVCLALTADANTVVFVADAPTGGVDVLGFGGSEPAIMVKNLSTGQQTRVTPLLSACATWPAAHSSTWKARCASPRRRALPMAMPGSRRMGERWPSQARRPTPKRVTRPRRATCMRWTSPAVPCVLSIPMQPVARSPLRAL